jgi:hypothetical protein
MKRAPLAAGVAVVVAVSVGSGVVLARGSETARSAAMPAATARALRAAGIQFRLAPARLQPPVSAPRALARIRVDMSGQRARPHRLWLVFVRHHSKTRLVWMAVGHSVGPRVKCPPDTHGCRVLYYGHFVELLDARSGNGLMVTGFAWPSPAGARHGRLLGGEVQVVAYPHGNVRICTEMFDNLVYGPPRVPICANGIRATGVRIGALKGREKGRPERWGYLYLVGRYTSGVFEVTSQRRWAPRTRGHDPFAKPPCRTPAGGWHVNGINARPFAGMRALNRYYRTTHHHDITSVAFFEKGDVLTLASVAPARTRRVLGPYWPRQMCVVKARYPRATVIRVRHRMVGLITGPNAPRGAAWGWPQGGGGQGVSSAGQPTTELDVFVVTPRLRALLRRQPPGIVVVQPVLAPLR